MNTNCLPGVIVTDMEIGLMNAIHNVLSSTRHLLCRWHINRYVMKACKGILKNCEKWEQFIVLWNMLVLENPEVDYERNLHEMDRIFEGKYSKALDYVKVNWLKEYKDRFVAVWTDTFMHFGNTTSNRAESAHSKLKRELGTSQCNFETSWAKIHAMLLLQHTEIRASFERSQSFVQHEFDKVSLLKDLIGYVSIVALEEILCESKKIKYVEADPIAYGCVIKCSHELPCAHEMADVESKREVEYSLDYFDDFPLEDRWMLIPEMGYLIANCYNVVLIHFLNTISLMFLLTKSHSSPEY
ncbi:unnamed protein product [Prunus brigantina]